MQWCPSWTWASVRCHAMNVDWITSGDIWVARSYWYMYWLKTHIMQSLIASFMEPTWGPSGADRTQVGPMLAPWTLLSGMQLTFHTVYRWDKKYHIHSRIGNRIVPGDKSYLRNCPRICSKFWEKYEFLVATIKSPQILDKCRWAWESSQSNSQQRNTMYK